VISCEVVEADFLIFDVFRSTRTNFCVFDMISAAIRPFFDIPMLIQNVSAGDATICKKKKLPEDDFGDETHAQKK